MFLVLNLPNSLFRKTSNLLNSKYQIFLFMFLFMLDKNKNKNFKIKKQCINLL